VEILVGGDEHLEVIIDAVPALTAYVDREQRFRVINASLRRWFGDIRGKRISDVLGERAFEHVRELLERVLAGETISCEAQLPFPDGVVRWMKADYVPDIDEAGTVRGYTLQLHDISEHKLAQQRLALLAETGAALASSVDQDTITQATAQAVIPMLGDWSAVYVERFGVLVAKSIAHVARLTADDVWQRARSYTPKLTTQATVEGSCAIVPLAARGKRLGALVLGALTPREWAKEDLVLLDELGRRASSSLDTARLFEQQRRANERLEEADRRKDELLAVVGHELRNPLAPIVTALDVMEYRGLVGCERERAVIRRQALYMSRLVDDLLDVARIRRGKVVLQKQPLELNTIVAKAIEQTSPLLEQRNHQLTIDVSRELVIEADGTRMTQVFANLLTNAAKYTQPRGHISIVATRNDDTVSVAISDDGPGIPAELLATIFDPFVQGEPTLQRADGGLGLGLSLVKSLTELHGGTAKAASDGPGRGSCFTIQLPNYNAVSAPVTEAPLAPGARLLLVDDNADAARVLAELLRECGYDVAVAHDAPAALILADEFRPAIALLDIGLPVMDGYELARHLRTRLPTPPRLVAVTGYGDHADSARSRDAGFDVHLGKPVDFEKLVSVLGSLSPS
jgi:PAS domain S-box-containing protein